uniref:D-amino-acid oxidase n=1 Tax=Myxine glutinosa TaxID=7769 RepID=UPI00358FEA70
MAEGLELQASAGGLRVAIVGAGVVGLSSALAIVEHYGGSPLGPTITVFAEKFSPHTTGDHVAGLWQPYPHGPVPPAETKWNWETFQYLLQFLKRADVPEMGLFVQSGYNLFKHRVPDPPWCDIVLGFRHLTQDELSLFPGWSYGWFNTTLMLECKNYLPWLMKKLTNYGIKFMKKKVTNFMELSPSYDVIINCTGVEAAHLVPDKEVQPGRGQLTKVYAPWLKHFYSTHDEQKGLYNAPYILPGSTGVVALGGILQLGNWNEEVNDEDRKYIWEGCCKLVPSLRNARVVDEWAGLRPCRSSIRLERETLGSGFSKVELIHNYGHGGYGVTIHWGCAQAVAALFVEICDEKKRAVPSHL